MPYNSRRYDKYCSIITRLGEHEMRGMQREDAGNYLGMVAEKENLRFTYPEQQVLIRVALSITTGDIHAFTTIIGRCITLARVMYYKCHGPPGVRIRCPIMWHKNGLPHNYLVLEYAGMERTV